jgi:RNA polymerase sigma factor (sigma-70 family)
MVSETRSSLIRRVHDPSDADGWREFVALYEPLLLTYVRNRSLAPDDARDVVQDIFAKLLKILPRFDLDHGRGRFRTWLWQVTCHALADWSRRRHRQARAEGEWSRRRELLPPSGDREQEAEWLGLHHRRILQFALEQVQDRSLPKTWACFEQHLLRGRPSAEVAIELGLNTNTVDVNSSRVLGRVRALCADYIEDLADGSNVLPG